MTTTKNWILWISLIVVAGLATPIIWIDALYHQWQKAQYRPPPTPNPHPKYYVTISGNIQPNMPYPMTVMFRASYAAYSPKCGVQSHWLDTSGLSYMPGKTVYYPAQPDKQGNYVIKIPIDAYQPGKCNWKIAWVMYSFIKSIPPKHKFRNMSWGDVIDFGTKDSLNEIPGYPITRNGTFYCGKGGLKDCTGTGIQGGYVDFSVLRTKSYKFIQNIKQQGAAK